MCTRYLAREDIILNWTELNVNADYDMDRSVAVTTIVLRSTSQWNKYSLVQRLFSLQVSSMFVVTTHSCGIFL